MSYSIVTIFSVAVQAAIQVCSFENLAFGGRTWQQYPWPDKTRDFGSENAVDGLYTNRSEVGGQCAISDDGKYTATWRVYLGKKVSISHIDIYYRTDNKHSSTRYTSRMAGFYLYVSNSTSTEDGHLCFHEMQTLNGTPSEVQRINCSVHGQEYGYYGDNCMYQCSSNCLGRRCNINSGLCLGCIRGFQGPQCSQVCTNQTYGQDCSCMCGKCINGETCHHVSGLCPHGCIEGVQGDSCQEECQIGYFGKDCKNKCSVNCKVTSSCDKITGQCDGGCKAGWSGNSCNQKVSENPCNENNAVLCPLTIVFSAVLVFAGSALNVFYWKRENRKCTKTWQALFNINVFKTELPSTKNSTDNINRNITSTIQHYMDINEADQQKTYDGVICYTNLNLQL